MENRVVQEFNLKTLLSDSGQYTIPVYQRNYAWGEGEINQLIQDIIDSQKKDTNRPYYLGTLVVYEREENGISVYETIDGQQRLTTLSILMSVLKNEWRTELNESMNWFQSLNLEFRSRKLSSVLLNQLFNSGNVKGIEYNKSSNIVAAYNLAKKQLQKITEEENVSIKEFTHYLLSNVKVLRVPVPHDTDLNHYFEIMNTRGEQLEKHEIVKAKLLEVFTSLPLEEKNELSSVFNSVWEATSNMEKYVQYGFNPTKREELFGSENWGHLNVNSFDELSNSLLKESKNEEEKNLLSIDEIINNNIKSGNEEEADEKPVRFYSVVNFENFLLHVLRLMKGVESDIPLDDKRLIPIFENEISKSDNPIEFVKEYCFQLFRTKFLFDKYIIKREFIGGGDHWSLKRLKMYNHGKKKNVSYVNTFGPEQEDNAKQENRNLLMLLSMFHVSTPTMVYKHWLSASLNFVFNNSEKNGNIDANDYVTHLEKMAKSFVFGRHLNLAPLDYHLMIFKNESVSDFSWNEMDENKLTFGNISNNLVFNYIDYLYWRSNKESNDTKITKHEYTYRSSVEHYYPQNPLEGGVKKLDSEEGKIALNSIGNLCLISHSKNSRLSNFSPLQKIEFYNNNIDSIKQYIMMKSGTNWDLQAIKKHNQEVIDLLKNEL